MSNEWKPITRERAIKVVIEAARCYMGKAAWNMPVTNVEIDEALSLLDQGPPTPSAGEMDSYYGKMLVAIEGYALNESEQAVAHEREACAQTAEDEQFDPHEGEYNVAYNHACQDIAQRIRQRTPKPKEQG